MKRVQASNATTMPIGHGGLTWSHTIVGLQTRLSFITKRGMELKDP